MTHDLIATTARSMFTSLFGGEAEEGYRVQLLRVQDCIEATLKQKSLPDTVQAKTFRGRLTDLAAHMRPEDIIACLEELGTLIEQYLARFGESQVAA